jgi:hypothetical protein
MAPIYACMRGLISRLGVDHGVSLRRWVLLNRQSQEAAWLMGSVSLVGGLTG